ncbi:MAG TPA: single-stranded DNA-binding protein [Tepidisphaeraceae bacterium]|jgi:single-strand DNA-binding protein
MADLNKVMLIGRLTRDPQLKFLPNNQMPICEFGFAVGRKFKTASGEQREESTFIDCTLFGKGGEIFNQYMAKGRQCYIEGRLKLDQWEDKNGGGKRSKLSVVVEEFQFLGDGQGQGGQRNNAAAGGGNFDEGGGPPPARPMSRGPARPPQQQPPAQAPYGEEQQFNEDDIPF